ncbi:MAG: type I restriction endonuclease [Acidiferrobacteraceae bacterium]
MTAKQLTRAWTEADLEAAIHGVLTKAFPWLPEHAIRHQTKFWFTFGRKRVDVDGAESSRAEARADVLLYNDNQPLAVLELKRPGVSLTSDDEAQGLSYARVLNPSPPLVVVTNGDQLRIIETHAGQPWQPTEYNEHAFQHLVTNAARIAAADTKRAIDTLMGTTASVWQQAVRHTSADSMASLCESWDKPAFPFVRDFLIPRTATTKVLSLVAQNAKLVIVEGPPLTGKSSVLRDITQRIERHPDIATLYIEGRSILQGLADALARSLAWPASQDEARDWLMRVSRSNGRKLLLVIDGLDIDDRETCKEIEDLSSSVFGDGLTVIVAMDDSVAEQIVSTSGGRSASAIGRRAQRVTVGPLNDHEFDAAQRVLSERRIHLMHGAYATPEFRQPWVLRAISARVLDQINHADESLSVVLPSLLGLELIGQARRRFTDEKLRRLFQAIATALLIDTKDQTRDHALMLESTEVYLVRRETIKQHLEESELQWLIDHGFLRPAMHAANEPVLYVRVPELLASEAARLLADELVTLTRKDRQHAAAWISGAAGNLPLGDVIAAQAIFDAAQQTDSLPFGLIQALLETPPKRESVAPGARMAAHIPGVGMVDLTFNADGTAAVDIGGQSHVIDLGEDGLSDTYSNIYEWLILSHLAVMPFAMETADGLERVDPQILMIVGTADIVLRKPGGDPDMRGVPTHDLPGIGSIVCHKAGIIEPITYSIFAFLAREGSSANGWIEQAIALASMPLLGRIHIALLQISSFADKALAVWAQNTLANTIAPAFKVLPDLHGEVG